MAEPAPQESVVKETHFRLGHRPVLDGVRAVAVLAVLAVHFGRGPQFDWPRGGFLGVDIFFVLSGFLITSILLEERARRGSFSFRAFYMRRALRLLPALTVLLAAFMVYSLTIAPASLLRDNLIATAATLTYWTNWLYAEGLFGISQTGLVHTWSLAIEEQFYIVWPIVLAASLFLGRRRAALAFALCGIAAVCVWRIVQLGDPDVNVMRMYFGFDSRADSLLIGCVLALVLLDRKWLTGARRVAFRLALLPAVLLIGAMLLVAEESWRALYLGGFTLFALATAVVLYNLVTWRPPVLAPLLESSPMVYVGRISYGLYLWHYPIYLAMRDELARGWLTALIGVPLTFLVAAASFRYVEQPFLRRKRRFERRSTEVVEGLPGGGLAGPAPDPVGAATRAQPHATPAPHAAGAVQPGS